MMTTRSRHLAHDRRRRLDGGAAFRVLLLVFIPLLWSQDSDGSCAWSPIWEIADRHAFIFEGVVLEEIRPEPRTEGRTPPDQVRYRVERVWKGEVPSEALTELRWSILQADTHVGESFLVCAIEDRDDPLKMIVTDCTRTQPLDCAEPELFVLEWISQGRPTEEIIDEVTTYLIRSIPTLEVDGPCDRASFAYATGYRDAIRELASCLSRVEGARDQEILDLLEFEVRDPERAETVLSSFARHVGDSWPGSVEWLLAAIGSAEPRVRKIAIRSALPRGKDHPDVRNAILRACQDEDAGVAGAALRIHSEGYVPPAEAEAARRLLLDLVTDPDSPVRAEAMEVLRSWTVEFTTDERLALMRSPDPMIWRAIASSLFLVDPVGDEESEELLLALDDPNRRRVVLPILRNVTPRSAFLRSRLSDWLPELSTVEQKEIVRGLIVAGVTELLPLLPELPPPVFDAALEANVNAWAPTFVWQVEAGLASNRSAQRLRALERSRSTKGDATHGNAVLASLEDENAEVREAALAYLGGLGEEWKAQARPVLEGIAASGDSLAERADAILETLRRAEVEDRR